MKWLHISDIHFKIEKYDTLKLRKSLLEKLNEMNLNLDYIRITGDIFYQYLESDDDIGDLKKFISNIAKACNVPNNKVYICPGNHDVNRKDVKRNELIDEIRKKDFLSSEDYEKLDGIGFEKFKLLYMKLKGSTKKFKSFNVIEPENTGVRIYVINTCLLSKDDQDYQKLRIFAPQINGLVKKKENIDRLNIVIMHHGVEWLHPDDARRFEHWVEDNGIDAIFCGHTHRAAIYTLNDVNKHILQFTSGTLMLDNYAFPSFYLCEGDFTGFNISLYTFSDTSEKWGVDTQHLRKFERGPIKYDLSRNLINGDMASDTFKEEGKAAQPREEEKSSNNENPDIKAIESMILSSGDISKMPCDKIIEELNRRYKEKFDSTKIFSNKAGEREDFNAWKIVNSLASINIPYFMALKLACEVVSTITSDEFPSENILESSRIKEIIYETILKSNTYFKGLREYEIGLWASTYSRHYNRKTGFILKDDGQRDKDRQITYSILRDSIMKQVVVDITKNELYYEKIFSKEKEKMAEMIMRFIKSLGIFEIRKSILTGLIREYVTERPHPWFVYGNRSDYIAYHIANADEHLDKLSDKNGEIHPMLQIEAAYHLCAALLSKYDNYVGCTEISPIKILNRAVKYKDIREDKNLPVFRYELIQMEKDIENAGYSFSDLQKNIEIVYTNIVTKKSVTDRETTGALIRIRKTIDYLNQDRSIILEDREHHTEFDKVYTLFRDASGFEIKKPLQYFDDCAFFVNPNWGVAERDQYNLKPEILVCMLTGVDDTDNQIDDGQYHRSQSLSKITSYLSIESKKKIKDLVIFKDTMEPFSSEERRIIREVFKNNRLNKRCIFIQSTDVGQMRKKEWREDLLRVIKASRYSS